MKSSNKKPQVVGIVTEDLLRTRKLMVELCPCCGGKEMHLLPNWLTHEDLGLRIVKVWTDDGKSTFLQYESREQRDRRIARDLNPPQGATGFLVNRKV
jgi:hypothetical protein